MHQANGAYMATKGVPSRKNAAAGFTRRGFLGGFVAVGCLAAAGPALASVRNAAAFAPLAPGAFVGTGRLLLVAGDDAATEKTLSLQFRRDDGMGGYDPEALAICNHFLRDWHADGRQRQLDATAEKAAAAAEKANAIAAANHGDRRAARRAEWLHKAALDAQRAALEFSAVKPIDPRLLDLVSDLQGRFGGRAVTVWSGYRTPETNATCEGVSHSMHLEARAVDITIDAVSVADTGRAALALSMGGVGLYPDKGFVHVDTGDVRNWTITNADAMAAAPTSGKLVH